MATPPKTTARKGPRAKAGATTARVETMRREALRLVNQGYSVPEVGEALGVTRQRAWQLVSEELDAVKAETHEDALAWRLKLTARHEARIKQLEAVAAGARTNVEAVAALDKARAVDVELGKLWGAYAATKTELTGADGKDLVAGFFAVPVASSDPAAWTADALAQAAGEEAEAERVLGAKPGAADEAAPRA